MYLKACQINDDGVRVATLHFVGQEKERIYNLDSDAGHKVDDVLKIFLKDENVRR